MLLLFFITCTNTAQVVSQDSQGILVNETYSNRGPQDSVHTVPDFSHAGYMGGGVAIPNVQITDTVNPGNGDHGARIQAEINLVVARNPDGNGFLGAVLLTAGTGNLEQEKLIT